MPSPSENDSRIRLAIVSTHPIQYYAPVFRALAQSDGILPRVFYTWSQAAGGPVFDPGFGASFAWDIPLLDGYDHVFVPNTAGKPGSDHFSGIRNPTLSRDIENWTADAVLIYGWSLHSHLDAMRHFKGRIPVLFRGDSTLLDDQGPVRRAARRGFLWWVYSHIDAAIAVGRNNLDYYRWCGVRSADIALAPHSIDTLRFGDVGGRHAARALQWRDELHIPPDAVTFVFAAKLMPKKDPLLLLDAFASIESAAHLVFVGNGELEPALRDRAAGLKGVHFVPFQNQSAMPAVYRLGDVYVLPSRGPGETWGLAMNEAMASGRPVIASSRVGGARDLVQEGVTGWTFAAGNRDGLAQALRHAIAQGRAGLLRMGEACRDLSPRWSSEATAAAIAAAVVNVIAGSRQRRRRPVRLRSRPV